MGRILKKKDPTKKKAQRAAGSDQNGAAMPKDGSDVAVVKPIAAARKPSGTDKPKMATTDPSLVQKSIQFLREVKIELKKVTWPTRKQTMGSTAVVVVLVVIIALFLGLVDVGLSSLIRVVLP